MKLFMKTKIPSHFGVGAKPQTNPQKSQTQFECVIKLDSLQNNEVITRKSITFNYMLYKGVADVKVNENYSIFYMRLKTL